jgi:hypothetical protein
MHKANRAIQWMAGTCNAVNGREILEQRSSERWQCLYRSQRYRAWKDLGDAWSLGLGIYSPGPAFLRLHILTIYS